MVQGRSRAASRARDIGAVCILCVFAAIVLIPLFWIIGTSFKPPEEYFNDPPIWFPSDPTLDHYKNVQDFNAGYRSLLNSFVTTTAATLISMILGTSAAYGLARLRQRGDAWAVWFISQRILPAVALTIPIFLLIGDIGWIDTWQGLIVPYVAINTPFVVWMMRGFFLDIPAALEESALTEGCTRWSALRQIIIPVALPGILSTAVFVYIYCWGEFLIASFITQTSNSVTVSVQLPSLTIANDVLYGEMSALSLISALPILIMGMAIQRYFVRGLTLGALKR
jgi:multiple sugar transport system permease protein